MRDEGAGGLEAVFVANRDRLVRFLAVRGAGDQAEDVVQDLWIKVRATPAGPIANPLAYLYRAANTIMIDRHRSRRRSERRDAEWLDENADAHEASREPSGERVIGARQEIEAVAGVLARLGHRREAVFRRHRIDGVPQRAVADELGVSLSTIESDLRIAYQAIAEIRSKLI